MGKARSQSACIHRGLHHQPCEAAHAEPYFWSDEEELVDPKLELEEACKPKCVKQLLQYQACVKRVEEDNTGHKHCTGQYFDFWHCVDKCVAPKLFPRLK